MKLNKKTILTTLLVVALAIAIALPTLLLIQEKRVDAKEVVMQSFIINYGTQGMLTNIQRVEDIYVIQYENSEAKFTLLYIDGLWVELGSMKKEGQ